MSLDKFNLVVSALENESQKRHWTFRRLHRDDMPNPSIEHGVSINAPKLSCAIYYDRVRVGVVLRNGAFYDFAQDSPSYIATAIARDIAYLNAEQEL